MSAVLKLVSDLAATSSLGHSRSYSLAIRQARQLLDNGLTPESPEFVSRLVEHVQQTLHDDFIDTVWPACPFHPHHPLWLDDEGRSWTCVTAGVAVAISEVSGTLLAR